MQRLHRAGDGSRSALGRHRRLGEGPWWALHYGGRGGASVLAQSALDIALWDLKARRANLPLWRLLGGFNRRVPCYAGGIDLDLPVEGLLKQTDDNLAKGFAAIKMKVGRPSLGADVARVKAMRDHLGEGFPLMADANMKWTVEEAIRAARAFQPFDLTWLEEPTIPDDVDGHRRILAQGGIAIAAGENLRTLWEFKSYIANDAVSYPEPDVTNCGGVTAFMKIARLAEAFNLPLTSHGAHDVTVHLRSFPFVARTPDRSARAHRDWRRRHRCFLLQQQWRALAGVDDLATTQPQLDLALAQKNPLGTQ